MLNLSKMLVICFSITFHAGNACAVGYFSRACKLAEIDEVVYGPAAQFLVMVGAPVEIKDLDYKGRSKRFVLESITTDYGAAKFWLWAGSSHYKYGPINRMESIPSGLKYRRFRYLESGWLSRELKDIIRSSPILGKLLIFNHNRGILFSSRAGSQKIVEQIGVDLPSDSKTYSPGAPDFDEHHFMVLGSHYYYDPELDRVNFVGNSSAWSCNLREFGFS